SANDVWGTAYNPDLANGAVFAHWDGTIWSPVSPAVTGTLLLDDVTINTPTDGWAVGRKQLPNSYYPLNGLVLHFDGSAWTEVPAPAGSAELYALSSTGPGDLWATGIDTTDIARV